MVVHLVSMSCEKKQEEGGLEKWLIPTGLKEDLRPLGTLTQPYSLPETDPSSLWERLEPLYPEGLPATLFKHLVSSDR